MTHIRKPQNKHSEVLLYLQRTAHTGIKHGHRHSSCSDGSNPAKANTELEIMTWWGRVPGSWMQVCGAGLLKQQTRRAGLNKAYLPAWTHPFPILVVACLCQRVKAHTQTHSSSITAFVFTETLLFLASATLLPLLWSDQNPHDCKNVWFMSSLVFCRVCKIS